MFLAGVIGDACHVNTTDCSDAIEFSECVEVNDSAICRCDEEHMSANNGTNCDIRKHDVTSWHCAIQLLAVACLHYMCNKKLSCRRETARRFMSLNISLSHSRSLKVSRNDTVE